MTDYVVSDYSTTLFLQNSRSDTVEVTNIMINEVSCFLVFQPRLTLRVGQTRQVVYENIYELESNSIRWPIEITYTDVSSGASYTQRGDDIVLVTNVIEEWESVLHSVGFNSNWGGCLNESLPDNSFVNICTCEDLNTLRDYVVAGSKTFRLNFVANIDFKRCDPTYITEEGWEPIEISAFRTINGNNHMMLNLYINRPTQVSVGLFGGNPTSLSFDPNIVFSDFALLNANVTGGV